MAGWIYVTCAAVFVTMVTFNCLSTGDARGVYPGRYPSNGRGENLRRILGDLMRAVKNVNRFGCARSTINIIPCQNNNDTNCTRTVTLNDNSTLINFPVAFNNTFLTPPVVVLGFAGMKFVDGQEINLNSQNITERGFDTKITVRGGLPDSVNLFWLACKKATF